MLLPTFQPRPEVWLLIAGLAVLYWYAIRRIGPTAVLPGEQVITRGQLRWGIAGLITLWLASDWPVHDLGERYLYSVHMFQHMVFQFAVAPMALLATPTWLARMVVGSGRGYRGLRRLTRLVPATLVFNGVVVLSHWPTVVNNAVVSAPLHYGVHVIVVGASMLMWMPICGPLPELRFTLPVQACHLLLQTIVPVVPAGWLTMAEGVVYRSYARTGRIWGMTTVEDQQVAGALMKVGGTVVLWVLIGIIFIRFATRSQDDDRRRGVVLDRRAPEADQLTWAEVERALESAGPAPAEPPRR